MWATRRPWAILGDAGEPIQTGSTGEAHQQGFQLVIGMMRRQDRPRAQRLRALSDGFVTYGSGGGLQAVLALPRSDPNPQGLAGDPPSLGKRFTVGRPCIRRWLQPEVDMKGKQAPALRWAFNPAGQGIEQDTRILPATKGNDQKRRGTLLMSGFGVGL